MTKPAWALSVLRGKRKNFGNLAGHVKGIGRRHLAGALDRGAVRPGAELEGRGLDPQSLAGQADHQGHPRRGGRRLAAKTGAAALVVSNHGGRQLDGAPSTISVLPKIVDAVGSDIEVMFDGGIRSGQDVLRALALGARSCMIGRAYVYGLGAAGQAGVSKAIDIIRQELDVSMALTGTRHVRDIDRRVLDETR